MSTTLTNGLKIPDKGSVDWYADMQNNYAILDGAVGTVAEHTTQIAGKAPAVHTHTKSDITDFPVYGNTAGTICEGNDSRLSDARTPVAHTHTKADVTDLLNSNFIPSANNSYDLGSSSNQWNNLYAKNYFYNGVAWGLDKANTWTGTNNFSIGNLEVQTEYTLGTLPQVESAVALFTGRTTDNNFVTNINFYQNPTRGTGLRFTIRNKWDNNDYSTTGTTRNAHLEFLQNIDKTAYLQWQGYVNNSLYPLANNAYDLGSSTNKWKSLNGVNPGALSFPKIGTTENTDYIDVSGNIDLSVTASQSFVAPATGWFCISFKYDKVTSCRISAFNLRGDCVPMGSDGYVGCYIPVTAGVTVTVRVNATAIYNARIYLCQGNV